MCLCYVSLQILKLLGITFYILEINWNAYTLCDVHSFYKLFHCTFLLKYFCIFIFKYLNKHCSAVALQVAGDSEQTQNMGSVLGSDGVSHRRWDFPPLLTGCLLVSPSVVFSLAFTAVEWIGDECCLCKKGRISKQGVLVCLLTAWDNCRYGLSEPTHQNPLLLSSVHWGSASASLAVRWNCYWIAQEWRKNLW